MRFCKSIESFWICVVDSEDICIERFAILKDPENSITCISTRQISEKCSGPYKALIFEETPIDIVGFLLKVLKVLAENDIPIMAYSTYQRDIILVPANKVEKAVQALKNAGFIEVSDRLILHKSG